MCLGNFVFSQSHADLVCRAKLVVMAGGATRTLFSNTVTHTGKEPQRKILAFVMDPDVEVQPLAEEHPILSMCSDINCLVRPHRVQEVVVYRSCAEPSAMDNIQVECLSAPNGGYVIPIPAVSVFAARDLEQVANDDDPSKITDYVQKLASTMGRFGFQAPDLPVPADRTRMQAWLEETAERITLAGMLKTIELLRDAVLHACRSTDEAESILEPLIGPEHQRETMFDYDMSPGEATEAQQRVHDLRTKMLVNADCQYVIYCTEVLKPGASCKATMMLESEVVPTAGFVHDDAEEPYETIETDIVLMEPSGTAGRAQIDMSGVGQPERPLAQMDPSQPWNDELRLGAREGDEFSVQEARDAGIVRDQADARDRIEAAAPGYRVTASRRVPAGIKLGQRVLGLPLRSINKTGVAAV